MARDTLARTQDTLKKTAYVAVGIPASVIGALRERWEDTRETVEEMRSRLSEDARQAFDEWVAEGEKLVNELGAQLRERREALERTIEDKSEAARTVGRGIASSVSHPVLPLPAIEGIGPSYADKLAKAGVFSVHALLDQARSEQARLRLSGQTGIGMGQLESWVAKADLTQIEGIGEEYLSLLHAIGVGTFQALASRDPAELRKKALAVNRERSLVTAVPSQDTFAEWVQAAGGYLS
jgi:predicted flap endonuclease-1-like 5' DNA nuclease